MTRTKKKRVLKGDLDWTTIRILQSDKDILEQKVIDTDAAGVYQVVSKLLKHIDKVK